MKTFSCQFGSGVTCTVEITDDQPAAGRTHILRTVWTGSPTPKVLRPYIAWMNSVNQQLADTWQAKLMHVFQTSPTAAEVWIYQPGGKPIRNR